MLSNNVTRYYSTDPMGDEQALRDFLTGISVSGIEEEIFI